MRLFVCFWDDCVWGFIIMRDDEHRRATSRRVENTKVCVRKAPFAVGFPSTCSDLRQIVLFVVIKLLLAISLGKNTTQLTSICFQKFVLKTGS